MRIGSLKKRIVIQLFTKVKGSTGGFIKTWADKYTVWASIWPISAKEQIANMGEVMLVTHKIRIRFKKNIKPKWRVTYNNRTFNIVSVINVMELDKDIDLLCEEIK